MSGSGGSRDPEGVGVRTPEGMRAGAAHLIDVGVVGLWVGVIGLSVLCRCWGGVRFFARGGGDSSRSVFAVLGAVAPCGPLVLVVSGVVVFVVGVVVEDGSVLVVRVELDCV